MAAVNLLMISCNYLQLKPTPQLNSPNGSIGMVLFHEIKKQKGRLAQWRVLITNMFPHQAIDGHRPPFKSLERRAITHTCQLLNWSIKSSVIRLKQVSQISNQCTFAPTYRTWAQVLSCCYQQPQTSQVFLKSFFFSKYLLEKNPSKEIIECMSIVRVQIMRIFFGRRGWNFI